MISAEARHFCGKDLEALAAHFSGVDGAAAKSSAEHDKESGPEQDEGTDGGSAGVYAPNWSFLAPLYALENCLPPQDDDQQAQSQDSVVANDDAGSRATYRRLWTLRVSLPEVVTSGKFAVFAHIATAAGAAATKRNVIFDIFAAHCSCICSRTDCSGCEGSVVAIITYTCG